MIRQFCSIAVALIFLAVSADSVSAQTESTVSRWVISNLPQGVTVRSATPAQLAAAMGAIQIHPKQAEAIVRYGFSQFTAADSAKALAVTDAVVSVVPPGEVAGLIKAAIGSLSAAVDPQTGQSAQLTLATLIAEPAIAHDPSLTSAIRAAIGVDLARGPGNVTNQANFANTTGAVNSPEQ